MLKKKRHPRQILAHALQKTDVKPTHLHGNGYSGHFHSQQCSSSISDSGEEVVHITAKLTS